MNVKNYIVIDDDTTLEYSVKIEENSDIITYSLYYSKAEHWKDDFRGKLILTMVNDGNNIKFSKDLNGNISYSDLLHIRILSNIEATESGESGRFKIISTDDLRTI